MQHHTQDILTFVYLDNIYYKTRRQIHFIYNIARKKLDAACIYLLKHRLAKSNACLLSSPFHEGNFNVCLPSTKLRVVNFKMYLPSNHHVQQISSCVYFLQHRAQQTLSSAYPLQLRAYNLFMGLPDKTSPAANSIYFLQRHMEEISACVYFAKYPVQQIS